jgi:nucleoside-diphosphate-sugar epimerase/glycosyltransferase involved in cell wall biosynthesis
VEAVDYRSFDLLTDPPGELGAFETAVWCAGRSDHRDAWADPSGELTGSTVALTRFLESFRGRLVLISTGAVYHGQRGLVTPATPLAPLHPYAVAKLAAEQLALAQAVDGRLESLVVLRLFHPFGPGERTTRIMPQALTRFVHHGKRDFRVRGDGSTLLDVQPVQSVADAAVVAATLEATGLVIDVCRGGGRRLVDVVHEVGQALGFEPEIRFDESSGEEPIEFEADPRLARSLLALPPDDDLGPAIRSYAHLFRAERAATAPRSREAESQQQPHSGGPQPDVSVIIPCLNEDQNVGALIDKLVRLTDEAALRAEILIVDDCSDDYTFREALMLSMRHDEVLALHKGLPRGIGNAIRFGLAHATGRSGVIVMGDNVDPLAAIPDFHRLIAQEEFDLVLLNRHASPEHRKSIPIWPYRVYQAIYRTCCRVGTGLPYRDPTYAYRGFSLEFLRSLELESGGFEISPEITLKAWLRGARIGELSGAQGRRASGASNFVFSQQALGFLRVLVKATLARRVGSWARPLGLGRQSSWAWSRRRRAPARFGGF